MNRLIAVALVIMALWAGAAVQADPMPVADVTASSQQSGNTAANTIDGDLVTRWAANGLGQWIQYQLEACGLVGSVKTAWYQGNARSASFDIETSVDGTTFATAFSGDSSGTTLALEEVDIPDTHACFVRIVGFGNNSTVPGAGTWNSITEVVIESASPPPPERGESVEVPLTLLEELCAPLLPQL